MNKKHVAREFRETGLDSCYWGQFLFDYALCGWITWEQLGRWSKL